MKKKPTKAAKPKHGGPRPGSGRKPMENPRVPVQFRLDPEIVAYLRIQHTTNMTAAVEQAIKDSKQFREWFQLGIGK